MPPRPLPPELRFAPPAARPLPDNSLPRFHSFELLTQQQRLTHTRAPTRKRTPDTMSKSSDKQRAEELDVWHSVKDVDAASVPVSSHMRAACSGSAAPMRLNLAELSRRRIPFFVACC
jgi:hypothetical protein